MTSSPISLAASSPSTARPHNDRCPVCHSEDKSYLFTGQGTEIESCNACGLVFRNPQPSDAELDQIYTDSYFLGSAASADSGEINDIKRATAHRYLDEIAQYLGSDSSRVEALKLLEVGCGLGNLVHVAAERGYDVTGVETSPSSAEAANQLLGEDRVICADIGDADLPEASFDVCVLSDVLEHTRDPVSFLSSVYRCMKPDGVLFISVPSLDSWSARTMRKSWAEFKAEHLYYFRPETIRNILFQSGFCRARISGNRKTLTPDYVIRHFDRFPVPVMTPLMGLASVLLPGFVKRQKVSIVASGINVLCRRSTELPPTERKQKLSIIIPVYNEAETFPQMMAELLALDLGELEREIIIVESNSTDGSREQVEGYRSHEDIKVILQERPEGKGFAVRTGLQEATGDHIIIQDADLEYDVKDYADLLRPLTHFRKAFVLGARHNQTGSWKIRHFQNRVLVSLLMNLGHVFFATMFNVLFRQRLRDPFTMYKVFRRDSISGLTFKSNRFDFDCELLAKLVRRGYTPVEIPVNYESRSFEEGKKISFFRDPPTYVWAFLKSRLEKLDAE